jgi:hypothetical protein
VLERQAKRELHDAGITGERGDGRIPANRMEAAIQKVREKNQMKLCVHRN